MEYFITVDGIPVHVNDSKKDGPAILFLHGYLETLYIWEDFISLFPNECRILSIDLPGHGLSGYPCSSFDINFLADFIRDLVLKLSVGKCCFITHLCGFYIASQFSYKYPDFALSIVNIGSPYTLTSCESSFIQTIKSSISDNSFLKLIPSVITRMYSTSNLRSCDDRIQETLEICETHDPDGISLFLDAILTATSLQSDIPVLTINGDHSFFDLSDGVSSAVKSINDTVIIPGAGANSFIEKPSEVYSCVKTFLNF